MLNLKYKKYLLFVPFAKKMEKRNSLLSDDRPKNIKIDCYGVGEIKKNFTLFSIKKKKIKFKNDRVVLDVAEKHCSKIKKQKRVIPQAIKIKVRLLKRWQKGQRLFSKVCVLLPSLISLSNELNKKNSDILETKLSKNLHQVVNYEPSHLFIEDDSNDKYEEEYEDLEEDKKPPFFLKHTHKEISYEKVKNFIQDINNLTWIDDYIDNSNYINEASIKSNLIDVEDTLNVSLMSIKKIENLENSIICGKKVRKRLCSQASQGRLIKFKKRKTHQRFKTVVLALDVTKIIRKLRDTKIIFNYDEFCFDNLDQHCLAYDEVSFIKKISENSKVLKKLNNKRINRSFFFLNFFY